MLENALTQEGGELSPETCSPRRIGEDSSVKGNLLRSKERLEKQLAKVNAGLSVLEKEPAFANSIETLLAAMRA